MANWANEYKDYGVINFSGSSVHVHKSPNSRLLIELGGNKVVEMATWAGDYVNVVFTENGNRKVYRFSSPNSFRIVS